jgi:hypothetical protein
LPSDRAAFRLRRRPGASRRQECRSRPPSQSRPIEVSGAWASSARRRTSLSEMAGAIEFSSVMLAALNCCCDRRERQHICGPGRVARGERGPIVHHLLAQFKERRAPIGRDHDIGHGMGKRCLGDSILVSAVGGPIPERRRKPCEVMSWRFMRRSRTSKATLLSERPLDCPKKT